MKLLYIQVAIFLYLYQNVQAQGGGAGGEKQIFVDVLPADDQEDSMNNLRTVEDSQKKFGLEDLSYIIEKMSQSQMVNYGPYSQQLQPLPMRPTSTVRYKQESQSAEQLFVPKQQPKIGQQQMKVKQQQSENLKTQQRFQQSKKNEENHDQLQKELDDSVKTLHEMQEEYKQLQQKALYKQKIHRRRKK